MRFETFEKALLRTEFGQENMEDEERKTLESSGILGGIGSLDTVHMRKAVPIEL